MKIYELLTLVNKKSYIVQIFEYKNNLSGGYYKQNKLSIKLLEKEVENYLVLDNSETISIWIKGDN